EAMFLFADEDHRSRFRFCQPNRPHGPKSGSDGRERLDKVSGCQGSWPFSMARRAKNQPVLTSVYWLTSSRLPPCCAIAPVIFASRPPASGQLSLRIETTLEITSWG